MSENVKILIIKSGTEPIQTERYDIPDIDPERIKTTILEAINRLGKTAQAWMFYKNKAYTCDHTADRGPSKFYYRAEVSYVPQKVLDIMIE